MNNQTNHDENNPDERQKIYTEPGAGERSSAWKPTTFNWKSLGVILSTQLHGTLASPIYTPSHGSFDDRAVAPRSHGSLDDARVVARSLGEQTSYLFPIGVKGIETSLAMLSATLVTITYSLIIGAGARMASTTKLPLRSIETNIGTMLSMAWPDISSSAEITMSNSTPDTIRLLYVGKMNDDDASDRNQRAAKGLQQCEAEPCIDLDCPPLWLTGGSQLTKNIVQLAVWEWLSMWLVMIMICATVLYNGFFTGSLGPDSYSRLAVALIYGIAYCVHALCVWRACRDFFTMVAAGASWSLLERANFATVDLRQYRRHLEHRFDTKLEISRIYKAIPESTPAYHAFLKHESDEIETSSQLQPIEIDDNIDYQAELRSALGTLDKIQADERTNATDAVITAHNHIVSNALMLIVVITSTAFASWNARLSGTDSTQLGSLALLATLGAGIAAMVSSVVQLNILNSSFHILLNLTEVKINGQAREQCNKRLKKSKAIGFTLGTAKPRPVLMSDLLHASSYREILSLVVFGPAFALLPSEEDHASQSADAKFSLHVPVRDKLVVMTTENTSKHSRNAEGISLEAINVCYRPSSTAEAKEPQVIVKRLSSNSE
ncbi:hypothetical protein K440DRAFT_654873 [Wilcoxina mikolae CBS 423.85]|nr:hypothetical protein K440DRAFT_654873 [Wilcoxina mikolae CBS 423.85]